MTILKRILFVSLFLAGVIALFFAEENWRGQRAWARMRADLDAKGIPVDFQKLVERRPPDAENVLKHPPMESWFIKDQPVDAKHPFLSSRPERTDKVRFDDKRYQLGFFNLSPHNGTTLDEFDSEKTVETLVGKTLQAPYGGTIFNPPATIGEIALRIPDSISTKEFAEKLNAKLRNASVIVEVISSNRLALFGNGPWISATDYLEWSDKNTPQLATIREAMKRPKVWLDGDYSRAFQIPIQNFVNTRLTAQHLASRANSFLLLKRPDEALAEILFSDDFRRILDTRPTTLVQAMIDVAICGLNAAVVQNGFALGVWKESHCAALTEKFKDINLLSRVSDAFRFGEIPGVINLVETSTGSLDPWDKLFRILPRGWMYLNLVEYARITTTHLDTLATTNRTISPTQVSEASNAILSEIDRPSPWLRLARIAIPNSDKAFTTCARNQNLYHLIAIASELERARLKSSRYPETLPPSAPGDVLLGRPFRYQPRADGYILYSPGWDLKDDLAPVLADNSLSIRIILAHPAAEKDWVWRGTPETKTN